MEREREREQEGEQDRGWPEKRVNHGGRVEVAAGGQRILMSPL